MKAIINNNSASWQGRINDFYVFNSEWHHLHSLHAILLLVVVVVVVVMVYLFQISCPEVRMWLRDVKIQEPTCLKFRGQELCESRGGRPGLPSLILLMVSVDVKQHWTRGQNRGQELCESGSGRSGLPSLIIRTVSVDVKQQWTCLKLYVFIHSSWEFAMI